MAKKVVFDSKQKQILAGLMPITPGAEIEFTPEAYRQKDEKGNMICETYLQVEGYEKSQVLNLLQVGTSGIITMNGEDDQ